MKKSRRTSMIVDKLHKGFVFTCIAVTIYGCSVLGIRYYKYVTQTKPQLQQQKLLENQDLLAEGSSISLKDTAPST